MSREEFEKKVRELVVLAYRARGLGESGADRMVQTIVGLAYGEGLLDQRVTP